MRKSACILACIMVCSLPVLSQNWDRHMEVKKMDIRIKANAFTAISYIEMEFYNPTHTEMEGLYSFELNPGQAITAFQLELNGKFRDGSIEEKWKARNAYNTIVGKRVDPALLQMDYYNHYSLRIYPVPAMGSRRISMTIQQLLPVQNGALVYKLPLAINDLVEKLHIQISVTGSSSSPFVLPGLLTNQVFTSVNKCFFELQWTASGIKTDKPVSFSIPARFDKPMVGIKKGDGKSFFAIRLIPSVIRSYAIYPKKITVFWDVSASSGYRDHSKEIDFLKWYIAGNQISKLQVITFNQQVRDTALFSTGDNSSGNWESFLRSQSYEGGTRFDILDFSGILADAILVFSDGRSSVGKNLPVPGHIQVYCMSAGPNKDSAQLERVAGKSGGKYINLDHYSASAAVELAGKAENILLDLVAAGNRIPVNQPISSLQEDTILLFGYIPSPEKNTMVLTYGNNAVTRGEEIIEITPDTACSELLTDRISMLKDFDHYAGNQADWMDILHFGKQEKVVTPNTSYIVLEKIEDYIRYNILPPAELETQCDMNLFVKADYERKNEYKKLNEAETLTEVTTAYNNRITWWDKKEPIITLTDLNVQEEIAKTKTITQVLSDKEPVSKTKVAETKSEMTDTRVSQNISGARTGPAGINGIRQEIAMSEVVVTAMGQTRQPKEIGYSITKVRSFELTQAKSVNVQNALTGKVSGLNVQTTNNGVFADTRITLRGIRSLTGNNQPLVILDGMPIEIRYLSQINPNTIRDIYVLKSAAATSIYGPDGVNGALLINSKTGNRFSPYYQSRERYRLKDQEDMDYVVELNAVPDKDKFEKYLSIKNNYRDHAGFYFDMAAELYQSGYRKEAINILYTAADLANGDWRVLKAIGYTLESWKEFDEAISLYHSMLAENENDLQTYRNLALAFYQKGNHQQAIDILYQAIKNDVSSQELKAMMLQEMNAIIALHKDSLDISKINVSLIRPLSVDLRIVFESNTGNLPNSVTIAEPGGSNCSAKNPLSLNGGRITLNDAGHSNKYVNSVSPGEYQIKKAAGGKYKMRISYRDYNSFYYNIGIPAMIKIMTFKNFGRPGQSIKIENVIMDNQFGDIEIGTVKW